MVVSMQILKELITVRLAADNSEAIFSSLDLGFRKPEPETVAAPSVVTLTVDQEPIAPAIREVAKEPDITESDTDTEDAAESVATASGGRRRRRRGRSRSHGGGSGGPS